MNRQEVYNTVRTHLMSMTEPSMSEAAGGCAYRGNDGCKCAIGILIKDEFYRPDMEGYGLHTHRVIEALTKSGVDIADPEDNIFLRKLQRIHDAHFDEREYCLLSFAKDYGLKS